MKMDSLDNIYTLSYITHKLCLNQSVNRLKPSKHSDNDEQNNTNVKKIKNILCAL